MELPAMRAVGPRLHDRRGEPEIPEGVARGVFGASGNKRQGCCRKASGISRKALRGGLAEMDLATSRRMTGEGPLAVETLVRADRGFRRARPR